MVSIPKVVGVIACGCVLGLALYLNGSHTIKGEVLRVEPSSYFVKQYDGSVVSDRFEGHRAEIQRCQGFHEHSRC
jgi:hypothetical protein